MSYQLKEIKLSDTSVFIATWKKEFVKEVKSQEVLSVEELNTFNSIKRSRKKQEYLFSRLIIKQTFKLMRNKFTQYTVKYCDVLKVCGIFRQEELHNKLTLAHCDNYITFTFLDNSKIAGIDIEKIKDRNVLSFASEVYSKQDLASITKKLSYKEQLIDFYRLWTEKEAVCKLTNQPLFTILNTSSKKLNELHNIEHYLENDYIITLAKNN